MAAFADDLQISAAGIAQGHLAFQEFLLAGERNIVANLSTGLGSKLCGFYALVSAAHTNDDGWILSAAGSAAIR